MFLAKYNPLDESGNHVTRFNSILNEFDVRKPQLAVFSPAINTYESEFAYHVDVDLPGVKKENIKIDVKNYILSISGERYHKEDLKEDNYVLLESYFGKFKRSITLPNAADTENITVSNKNGVLEVIIPKLTMRLSKLKSLYSDKRYIKNMIV